MDNSELKKELMADTDYLKDIAHDILHNQDVDDLIDELISKMSLDELREFTEWQVDCAIEDRERQDGKV